MQRFSFTASMDKPTKLLTYIIGYGLFLGVSFSLAIGLAIGLKQPVFLLLPIPFALILLAVRLYRIEAIAITDEAILIERNIRTIAIPLEAVASLSPVSSWPKGLNLRIAGSGGIYGYLGVFWNRNWGRFYMYVSRCHDFVDILSKDGRHFLVSPDNTAEFLQALETIKQEGRYDFTINK